MPEQHLKPVEKRRFLEKRRLSDVRPLRFPNDAYEWSNRNDAYLWCTTAEIPKRRLLSGRKNRRLSPVPGSNLWLYVTAKDEY